MTEQQGHRTPPESTALPSQRARAIAFAAILVGGLMGALAGYGVAEQFSGSRASLSVGVLLGGILVAGGVGLVANISLKAVSGWNQKNKLI